MRRIISELTGPTYRADVFFTKFSELETINMALVLRSFQGRFCGHRFRHAKPGGLTLSFATHFLRFTRRQHCMVRSKKVRSSQDLKRFGALLAVRYTINRA